MLRSRSAALALVLCLSLGGGKAAAQKMTIGIIDFYGLNRVTADRARAALTFKEGDSLSLTGDELPPFPVSETALAKLPGVQQAHVNMVCCDNGKAIVYVGIVETGAPAITFRAAPTGSARIAADIVSAGGEYEKALMAAVQRGDAAEDRSQGHSLMHDSTTRAVQTRFITYAQRDLAELRNVLRSSSNADERALAAQVLGYAPDKAAVINDLAYAMSDPAEEVRNNAMRALLVIAEMKPSAGKPAPRIPVQPFIPLLNSPVWTDRNKSSGALVTLTANRDPAVLEALRRQALSSLVEMARWKSEGHAQAAYMILGRIAGFSDKAAFDLWQRGERETVIKAAVLSRS